ncbi:uncharacterized protein LOC126326566 [Schistocerca gregaria]|uniref:uncharacterized protein LOC126326566 n=1 Tax=Schistocerca gregaria TaxID=7010 RepID=UPI00211E6296|nr:uncharacterized protein LOC126326566 [Schistocerca gregaria]
MEDSYDCVILGTGLTECILSGLLSVDKMNVLHMDRNDYYGGACASLNLEQAFSQFGEGKCEDLEKYGRSRDWNIDLVPKFIMTKGKMVSILLHCNVTCYLEFKSVDGSFVYEKKKIHKVPATETEALSSSLMGFFEKYRFKDFLLYCVNYDPSNPKTFNGKDLKKLTAKQLLTSHKLDKSTIDFVGHAMALYLDDSYLDEPALEFVERVKLYADSLSHAVCAFKGRSPYLYPAYGLGDLPQAFARLASIYGGTYMLSKPFDGLVLDENGRVAGVKSGGETARCKKVIADPSYFPDKVQKKKQIVRAICILDHPIPDTGDADSAQIIIPQKQVNRKSDIYINVISHAHHVASVGKYIAIISTTVETSNPKSEIDFAVKLLGPIMKIWYSVLDLYEPINDSEKDQVFISKSYDATPHFETVIDDVMRLYTLVTGRQLDLSKVIPREEVAD